MLGRGARESGPTHSELTHIEELFSAGLYAEATAHSQLLTDRYPDSGISWKLFGASLHVQGKDALPPLQRATELLPDDAETHSNLSIALQSLGQHEDAVACLRQALKINPRLAEAHYNLGISLKALGQFDAALASFHLALEIKPKLAEAFNNMGNVLRDLGKFDEAAACFQQALNIAPILAEAHLNLGNTLRDMGRLDEARASYRWALEIKPDFIETRVALVMLTLLIAPKTVKESVEVSIEFDQALVSFTDWLCSSDGCPKNFHKAIHTQQPFFLAYRYGNHVDLLSRYGDLVAQDTGGDLPVPRDPARKKLRLVVVSQHFRRHSVWDVNLRGLLQNIDRQKFEIVLFYIGKVEDGETLFAKTLADIWRDVHTATSLDGWLGTMMADQPDIIFYPEIGMDPITLGLASHRLAPLQVASWGHPITTGLPTIDVYFSGELLEPPDADAHYRERLVRLPGTGCCTTPIEIIPESVPELEAELALRSGVRFVIAQTPFKFDPADDMLYSSIAAAVGNSTFILLRSSKYPWATDLVHARLSRTFRERGLEPEQHLLVIPWLSREKFYGLLDMCDVYLDCPSFSGYTTAWQAIHRGISVVTLEGKFMRQRLAAGLMRKIGLIDTIATSYDDYVTIAARLAEECQTQKLRNVRRYATQLAAPQADQNIAVVRAFEKSLISMFNEKGI